MMISKIGATPAFTSRVNIVYDNNNEYMMKKFYENKTFKNEIKKLENNGDRNTVTLYPYAFLAMGMQIEKTIDGKKYYTNTLITESPNEIADAYKIASGSLKLKPSKIA